MTTTQSAAPIFPRLKNGVFISSLLSTQETSVTMATSSHGVAIKHSGARSIIEQFTHCLS